LKIVGEAMSQSTTNLATTARFISLAFVSFLLCTGGLWLYQNRDNFKEAAKERSVSEWVVRAAGGDPEMLRNPFGIEPKPMSDYMKPLEFNTEIMDQVQQSLLYNPDN
jgi:hypothetical protein